MAVKVLDGVFLGDAEASFDPDFLDMNKISNMVNLSGRETANAYASHGLVYLTYMWEDNEFFSIYDSNDEGDVSARHGGIRIPAPFKEMVDFIDSSVRYGISVLLFSQDGGGRPAVAMCAYLMLKYRWSCSKAMELVMTKKGQSAMPNPGFIRQLEALDASMLKQRGYLKKRDHPDAAGTLRYPKGDKNGAIIYDMVADFPPLEHQRWGEYSVGYLQEEIAALRAADSGDGDGGEKKSHDRVRHNNKSEEKAMEEDEYDHQRPAYRELENELVVVISHMNLRRTKPAPSETMALDKPRSKGKRLGFKERITIVLGPETSENSKLRALSGGGGGSHYPPGGGGGGGSRTAVSRAATPAAGSGAARGGGMMQINGNSMNMGSRGAGAGAGAGAETLAGGDSMDMSSIDCSASAIRSSLRGARKSGRANPLDIPSLQSALPSVAVAESAAHATRPRAVVSSSSSSSSPRSGGDNYNPRGGFGSSNSGGGSKGSSKGDGGGGSSHALLGDLYGFVGMESTDKKNVAASVRQPQKEHFSSINSPGRQVEAELAKVSALMNESDRRLGRDAKSGGESSGRRLVRRSGGGGAVAAAAEEKNSGGGQSRGSQSKQQQQMKGEGKYSDNGNGDWDDDDGVYGFGAEVFEDDPAAAADTKSPRGGNTHDNGDDGDGAKLSLHDLAYRPMYDSSSNQYRTAAPSSLSPAARERDRSARSNEATTISKVSLEMLASGGGGSGSGAFAHTATTTVGKPSRHHAAVSGAVSGSPPSHDRTRDLSYATHGRGQFRDTEYERAAGMNDDDRGITRAKIGQHAPPSSTALTHGAYDDDPLAAFDLEHAVQREPLRSREHVIPIKYPMEKTRPSSASIANQMTGVRIQTGRPGSASTRGKSLVGSEGDATYRSPYGGNSLRPGSASNSKGSHGRPGSARPRPGSASNGGGVDGYAGVYLKGAAVGKTPASGSGAKRPSSGRAMGSRDGGGSVASGGSERSRQSAGQRGAAGGGSSGSGSGRKVVRRGA